MSARAKDQSDAVTRVGSSAVVVPRSVQLMLEKYNRHYAEKPPHKRKRVDVACVIHATSIKRAAEELEELARTILEGGVGYVGSGGGYYMTIAWATTKRHNGSGVFWGWRAIAWLSGLRHVAAWWYKIQGIRLLVILVANSPNLYFDGLNSPGSTSKYFVTAPLRVNAICPPIMRVGSGKVVKGIMVTDRIFFTNSFIGFRTWSFGSDHFQIHGSSETDLNSIMQTIFVAIPRQIGNCTQDTPRSENREHSNMLFSAGPNAGPWFATSNATISRASAVTVLMGLFNGSFSQASFAKKPAINISPKIPIIKILHPQSDRAFLGFTMFFSDSHSAILSKNNPKNTIAPPIAAKNIDQNSDDEEKEFNLLFYVMFGGLGIVVAAFIVLDWFMVRRR